MSYLKLLLFYSLFNTFLPLQAQIKFIVPAAQLGRNSQMLFQAQIVNTSASARTGYVRINVTEEISGKPVMHVQTQAFVLSLGTNSMSRFAGNASISFFDNEFSRMLQTSRVYVPGDYSFCYEFIADDKEVQSPEHCAFVTTISTTPLYLIEPLDTICELRPAFLWQGKKISPTEVVYKVVCAEVKEGQNPEEALLNNPLLVNQVVRGVLSRMSFPAGSMNLKEGHRYAWQVHELAGQTILNSSEIYIFIPGCKTILPMGQQSFAEAKSFYTGKKYHYSTSINFSFQNSYAAARLDYSIVHVATQKKLTNLPVLEMKSGLNQIVVPVSDLKGIMTDEQYKLEIHNIGTGVHYLNFIISNEK